MDNQKLVTVFTPTYNRKNCIHHCYESLKRQTSQNFEWLIIDDGSTDHTDELIQQWQKEDNHFQIRYFYKENGGLHTAYNKGIEFTKTELFMCIDSDDWMPDNAIELIETIWKEISNKNYAGIMGIDRFENGDCVGGMFPDDIHEMFLYEKLTKYRIPGDKKMIHRTDLLKKVAPMPVFEGEKNFNPSYLMYQLDQFGKLYVTNDCFCIVEYQPDGMSSNIFRQYRNSPLSFAATRKLYLSFPDTSWEFKLKHSIHYISSCILGKKFLHGFQESPYLFHSLIGLIPALGLSLLVLWKSR